MTATLSDKADSLTSSSQPNTWLAGRAVKTGSSHRLVWKQGRKQKAQRKPALKQAHHQPETTAGRLTLGGMPMNRRSSGILCVVTQLPDRGEERGSVRQPVLGSIPALTCRACKQISQVPQPIERAGSAAVISLPG